MRGVLHSRLACVSAGYQSSLILSIKLSIILLHVLVNPYTGHSGHTVHSVNHIGVPLRAGAENAILYRHRTIDLASDFSGVHIADARQVIQYLHAVNPYGAVDFPFY